MIDREKILKLRSLLESPFWGRLEDDILNDLIIEYQLQLETLPLDKIERVRGKLELLRYLLSLPENAKTALMESK